MAWEPSGFRRCFQTGSYPVDWGTGGGLTFSQHIGQEWQAPIRVGFRALRGSTQPTGWRLMQVQV